jgi:hypothetical protein
MKTAALCVHGIETDNAKSQGPTYLLYNVSQHCLWTAFDGRRSYKALPKVVGQIEESHLNALMIVHVEATQKGYFRIQRTVPSAGHMSTKKGTLGPIVLHLRLRTTANIFP